MKNKFNVPLAVGSFLFGVMLTYLSLTIFQPTQNQSNNFSETRETGYQFINPLLECERVDSMGDTELKSLQKKLEQIVDKNNQVRIGIYYRDLNNGPWLGINEEQPFSPQSLLKMPVALAFYKLAENDPVILEDKISYSQEIEGRNLDENLEVGQEYPIDQLIYRMLTQSDNVAFNLLTLQLPDKFIKKVHQDLNISYPDDSTPDDFVSVKSYASIFRVLYNSSYLSRRYSELMLQFLSESSYTDGLVAGISDPNISVAHKYGVLNSQKSEYQSQLHDCGIVYLPEKPYLLCVMTKGDDQQQLVSIIQEVSKTVFDEVSQAN